MQMTEEHRTVSIKPNKQTLELAHVLLVLQQELNVLLKALTRCCVKSGLKPGTSAKHAVAVPMQ
jgi:hypothetical protein